MRRSIRRSGIRGGKNFLKSLPRRSGIGEGGPSGGREGVHHSINIMMKENQEVKLRFTRWSWNWNV